MLLNIFFYEIYYLTFSISKLNVFIPCGGPWRSGSAVNSYVDNGNNNNGDVDGDCDAVTLVMFIVCYVSVCWSNINLRSVVYHSLL